MRSLALLIALWAVSASSAADERYLPERVLLRTKQGDVLVALFSDAPQTARQFLHLASSGVFDGTRFLRAEPGFVVQVGAPATRRTPLTPAQRAQIHKLPLEVSPVLRHRRGSLSLAHPRNQPDSGDTSFAILLADAPQLDGQYTVFGEVERGMEVIDAISRVETGWDHAPTVSIWLNQMRVVAPGDSPELSGPTEVQARRPPRHLWWFGLGLSLLALATVSAGVRHRRRPAAALALSTLLLGICLAFALAVRPAMSRPWLGALVVIAALATLRLLATFER
jgi:cyclophilin family peptidyl-prolyl cis-trans isomerase